MTDQLRLVGISRSAETLRRDIVNDLVNYPFTPDGSPLASYIVGGDVDEYLAGMRNSGTFGDCMTLQRAAQLYQVNFFIFSSLGSQATTVVSPHEEFNYQLPPLNLGHMAEGHGEHYISLTKASADVISDVLAERGLSNDVDLTNCWSPPLEEPCDTPREDVTTKCLSLQRDETEVKLHNDVLLEIIRWSLIGDRSMLGT